VLAACSSGLGEMLDGEELVGMSRGFLYAGARSLLVTLWDVEDRASAEFMEAFYRELINGGTIQRINVKPTRFK
jgi:CHAT domain-containing protein